VIFTQLFFDPAVYFDFVARARARGLTAPIVPGVMPISSASQLERFTTMCGATIPNRVRSALDELSTPEEVSRFGIAYAIEQCQTLLAGGAPGIHFYTINRASQIEKIVSALQWQ
jgi:methylenetetrahydrofolate reductase (NADPH)